MMKIKKQEKQKDKVDMSRLIKYIKQNKGLMTLYIVFALLEIVLSFYSLTLLTEIVNLVTLNQLEFVMQKLITYPVILILTSADILLQVVVFRKIIAKGTISMRNDLMDRFFKINSASISNAEIGKFIGRITYTPEKIMRVLWDVFEAVRNLLYGTVICFYLVIQNWMVGLLIIGLYVIMAVLEKFRVKLFYKNYKTSQKSKDEYNSHVSELIKSEKDIKTLDLEKAMKVESKKLGAKEAKLAEKTNTVDTILWQGNMTIANFIVIAVYIFSFYMVLHEAMLISFFVFLLMNLDRLKGVSGDFAACVSSYSEMKAEVRHLNDIFDENQFKLERFGNKTFEDEFKGQIEFRNVAFGYQKDKYIFKDMNFLIPQGKTVAFVGKSGSGKTTLVSLISKLYEVSDGEILLDNKNINNLTKESIRQNIALINQFPYVFNTTIRENLKLSNVDASDEEFWQALNDADLKSFVERLPNQLDTVVGENGVKLSGGQKQRLAIARAFLKKSKILIFDESTSSLDNFAQAHVQKSIEKMKGQKTIIIVAHRLSTIKNADIIYFIDEGKILNQGSFEFLFNNEEKFKALFIAENVEHN